MSSCDCGDTGSGTPQEVPIQDYASSDAYHKPRLEALTQFFRTSFGGAPEFFVCVPGRVNLIGEHIDYNGYPVLPMAIRQNILLAVRCSQDEQLLLRNIQSDEHADYSADINDFKIELPAAGKPAWHNYVLCGLKGIRDTSQQIDSGRRIRGLHIAVSGNIPTAAGLSSSSALVCAATLAASYAKDRLTLDARELANIAAHCERYIGTEGGGMDQAIAFLAQHGAAMHIDWRPLRATVVRLPPGVVFVIANSLASANKADTASEFNQRVVECRLASCVLAKKQGVAEWRKHKLFAKLEQHLGCSRAEFSEMVSTSFENKSSAYTRADLLQLLGIGDEELAREFLTENTRGMQEFWLYRRALHVVHERDRVFDFRNAAEANNVEMMGSLMQASHESLSTKYDCSHPCLDRMVAVGDSKRFASRLTGAGWGGCTVALCRSAADADAYIRLMRDEYYAYRPEYDKSAADEQMFATSPQGGAVIILNNSAE